MLPRSAHVHGSPDLSLQRAQDTADLLPLLEQVDAVSCKLFRGFGMHKQFGNFGGDKRADLGSRDRDLLSLPTWYVPTSALS